MISSSNTCSKARWITYSALFVNYMRSPQIFPPTLKYVGITLRHNREKRHIDMSILGYVKKAMQRFQRIGLKGADSPITYVPPNYSKQQQEAPLNEPSTPLTPAETKELQEIVGVFLFYARAVDPTMLTAINKIASRQAKPTSLIKKEVERFLQSAAFIVGQAAISIIHTLTDLGYPQNETT